MVNNKVRFFEDLRNLLTLIEFHHKSDASESFVVIKSSGMSIKQIMIIALVAAISAIVVVAVLRYFGFVSPVTVAGVTIGSLTGGIIATIRTEIEEKELD